MLNIPYLAADPALAAAWAVRLPAEGLRAGLVWAWSGEALAARFLGDRPAAERVGLAAFAPPGVSARRALCQPAGRHARRRKGGSRQRAWS